MKHKLAQYILFVYEHYIKEDLSCLHTFARIIIYPAWIVRSILAIIYSIVFFPIVLIHMKVYDKIDKIMVMLDEIQQKYKC